MNKIIIKLLVKFWIKSVNANKLINSNWEFRSLYTNSKIKDEKTHNLLINDLSLHSRWDVKHILTMLIFLN